MDVLLFQINLNKIDKTKLYKTDKGIYLSGAVIIKDENDQYGNCGFITQNVKDKEDKSETKNPIIGNVKLSKKGPEPVNDQDINDLVF
jgi:hypothetical protein